MQRVAKHQSKLHGEIMHTIRDMKHSSSAPDAAKRTPHTSTRHARSSRRQERATDLTFDSWRTELNRRLGTAIKKLEPEMSDATDRSRRTNR